MRLHLALLLLASCPPPAAGYLRFRDSPPVRVECDREPVPLPARRASSNRLYHLDAAAGGPILRWLDATAPGEALDVNSLDEVPDSTWYTNRAPDPAMVFRGPGDGRGPDESAGLVVTRSKTVGVVPGFWAMDPAGVTWIVKLDPAGLPETGTAAEVVAGRLVWAGGWNVPENHVIRLDRDRLAVGPDATFEDMAGKRRRMTAADLDAVLARAEREPDGAYRAVASRLLPGRALGGFSPEGTRPDDPNDAIPHERRRSLRGLVAVFSWLDQVDVKPDNTLDTWLEDRGASGLGHVVHHLLDFGGGLGTVAAMSGTPWAGFAHADLDYGVLVRSLLSAGAWVQPWERLPAAPALRGVGRFVAAGFDPGRWKPLSPWTPFEEADARDWLWGAKVVARLTPAHVRAAVEAGRYSDPRAAAYIERVLLARRETVLRYAFGRVNPLDGFRAAPPAALCFDDLLLVHGLADPDGTRYEARAFDDAGRDLGWRGSTGPDRSGAACVRDIPSSDRGSGHVIVAIATARAGARAGGPVHVHLARGPEGGAMRVIGVDRGRVAAGGARGHGDSR